MTTELQNLQNDFDIILSQIENHLASFPNIYIRHEQVKFIMQQNNIWVSTRSLCLIYQCNKQNINYHIQNLYHQEEIILETISIPTIAKEHNRFISRNIKHYNLQITISLSHRIQTTAARLFRTCIPYHCWAILSQL